MKPIEELKGRELDAAVTEEVMGRHVLSHEEMLQEARDVWKRQPACRSFLKGFECTNAGNGEPERPKFTQERRVPFYSSSWDAARQLVEKVQEEADIRVKVLFPSLNKEELVAVVFEHPKRGVEKPWKWDLVGYDGEGATFPEAACRAALAWARGKGQE